jgi:hypothetical protein
MASLGYHARAVPATEGLPQIEADNCAFNHLAARAAVLADPRVSSRARETQGFEANIGKYVSLAYLEAEAVAF